MSLGKSLLFILLTTVFRLVGNQTEPMQQVKVGDTAVLPCNVSALMNGEDSENSFSIWWVTNDGPVCEFTKGKSQPYDDYCNRTEISKEENSEHLYHLIINETRLSDEGKYYCKLQKPGGNGEDVASVQLIVQGREENVSVVFGKTLAIGLPVTKSARVRFAPASSSTEADVCTVRQNTLTPASAYASRAALKNNELRLDRVTFADEGNYSVIDDATGRVMKIAVLAVEGLVENCELHEGDNLTIPLCCLSSPYIEFCGLAGNSTADGVCQGHVERLTVRNGSLTLSNFTAKDQGKYIVREKMGGRAILSLTLKTKPVGHDENVAVVSGKTLAIGLPVTKSARVRFAPASSSTEADVCTVQQNTLTPASAYTSRAALEKNELRLDRVTFADEGSYSVIDVATERVMKTAVLAVEGLVENHELHEGKNLTIPLCCLSSPYIEFCGPAGNSTADGVCQGHVERLTVRNGSLTLSNFTSKDQGKYIVREKMGGGVILTLTLKTIPVGNQSTDWRLIVGVIGGIFALQLLLLVGISVCAITWYQRRRMEWETSRIAEQLNEQIPLSEIKSSGDVEEK